MTPEQAWERYHRELEQVAWEAHVGDPTTIADNKAIMPSWAMKLVFVWTWEKAMAACQGEPARAEALRGLGLV